MTRVLFPMASRSTFFSESEYPFPLPLAEVCGRTLIEIVIENFTTLDDPEFIFVISEKDSQRYRLDHSLRIATKDRATILKLSGETKGGLCSALMAISQINCDRTPLVIANYDQVFDINLSDVIATFSSYDAGVITFESIHPRWSYTKVDANGFVIEVSEKRPISNRAIAGVYYFSSGAEFISAALNSVWKNSATDGSYYISSSLNELILLGKSIRFFDIPNGSFHSLYTPQRLRRFDALRSGYHFGDQNEDL